MFFLSDASLIQNPTLCACFPGANIQVAHVQSMATSLDALQAGPETSALGSMNSEKNLGYLMYIGIILPNYIGIIINQ